MSDYVVCIPSYKRAEICRDKTLATLKKMKIPSSKIYVYMANKEEHDEYEKVLVKGTYNKLVVGFKGIVPQRQFIMDQWPEGKHIVCFDDDIASIDLTMSKQFKGKSLEYFFKAAFAECKKQGAYSWGVYPVYNPFFRKGRSDLSTDLTFLVGAFYGIINRPKLKSIQWDVTKNDGQMEDVERTIKYFIEDGVVLRFNKIGFETKYYGKSGGLGTFEERLKPMLEAAKRLKKAYPEYGELRTKSSGVTDFRLKKLPSRISEAGVTTDEKNKTKSKKIKNNKTRKN